MRAFRAAGVAFFFAVAARAAVPAHYLVFTVDREGRIALYSRSEVMLAAEPESDPVSTVAGQSGESVRLDAANYHKVVEIDRTARVEWADPATGETRSQTIELEQTAFAVRVPASAGDFLDLAHSSGRSMRVDLKAIPATLAAMSGSSPTAANRLDLLIMGDGYRSGDRTKFESDATNIADAFLGVAPYREYRNYIQVTTLFTASADSGADHPKCRSDPFALADPREGTVADTAFDATFCASGQQRLLTVNVAKVLARAAASPDWDKIVVIVNDDLYGGSGLPSAMAVSLAPDAVNIIQHEFGHSFTGLADEYETPYPGYPPCSDLGSATPCEPNVTNQKNRALIKWNSWIDPGTSIPTAGDFTHVGLFLGARYQSTGFYRPKFDCLMNHLGAPFCEICRQAFILRLYRGFGGIPASGIDMIEPGSETPSPAAAVTTLPGSSLSFSFTLLQPDGGPAPSIQWSVDGVAIAGASSTLFVYQPPVGNHTVSVVVADTTTAVRDDVAALVHRRVWNVSTVPPAPPKRRAVPH